LPRPRRLPPLPAAAMWLKAQTVVSVL